MNCPFCNAPPRCEHPTTCPQYEPGLTQEEIRRVRQLLNATTVIVGLSRGPDGEETYPHVVARPMRKTQVDSPHSGGETEPKR